MRPINLAVDVDFPNPIDFTALGLANPACPSAQTSTENHSDPRICGLKAHYLHARNFWVGSSLSECMRRSYEFLCQGAQPLSIEKYTVAKPQGLGSIYILDVKVRPEIIGLMGSGSVSAT